MSGESQSRAGPPVARIGILGRVSYPDGCVGRGVAQIMPSLLPGEGNLIGMHLAWQGLPPW